MDYFFVMTIRHYPDSFFITKCLFKNVIKDIILKKHFLLYDKIDDYK